MDNEQPGARPHPTDPPAVGRDPFWSQVRRRHPATAVVLLPPDRVNRTATSHVPTGVARSSVRAAAEAWTSVAPLLAGDGATEPPFLGWRPRAGGHAFVVQQAARGLGERDGAAVLRALTGRLGRAGWLLAPRTRQGRPFLRARTAGASGLLLQAEAGPAATVVTLTTEALPVSAVDQESLQREAGSWA